MEGEKFLIFSQSIPSLKYRPFIIRASRNDVILRKATFYQESGEWNTMKAR